jgi:hypothetical protein
MRSPVWVSAPPADAVTARKTNSSTCPEAEAARKRRSVLCSSEERPHWELDLVHEFRQHRLTEPLQLYRL